MVVEANLTAASLLGVTRASMLQVPFTRFIVPEDQDIYYHHRLRLIETGGPQVCELRLFRHDNSEFWARLEAVAVHGHGEEQYRVVLSDISEFKRMEEGRQKLKEQLAEIKKMESMERLAGGVANDFNNMLAIILGNAEVALNYADSDQPFYANLLEISKAVDRSAKLTWNLLSYARMQAIETRGLDLNETVRDRLAMLRGIVGQDVELVWTPGSRLWPVTMDPSQVEQILVNLCSNARDAIDGKGRITVETKNAIWKAEYNVNNVGFTPGEYVALVVSDDGCGIARDDMGKLFEPFFTTKKSVGCRVGLGLAIVYGIVKQNSGFIYVYSEPDRGAAFKIYLPRHAAEVQRLPRIANSEPTGQHYGTIGTTDQPGVLMKTDERAVVVVEGKDKLGAPLARRDDKKK